MKNWQKVIILRVLFYVVCIVPPSVTILAYFDLFTPERKLSALTVMMLFCVLIVFWKGIFKRFFSTPAPWKLALILVVADAVSQAIHEKMWVIYTVFFISTTIGAVLWNAADNISKYGRWRKPIAVDHTPEEYQKKE